MNSLRVVVLVALLTFHGGVSELPAQFAPGAGEAPAMEPALRKLFEKVDGFSSAAVVNITDGGGAENVTLTVAMSMLKGDMRTEVDLAKMEGAAMPPGMLNQLKAAGMDRMVTLSFARDGRSLMVYPGLKAYAELKPARAAGAKAPECTMEKTAQGTEAVGGKDCEKSSVKFKCEGLPELVMTVWFEKSGKGLPVKLAMIQEGVNLSMEFRDFKETKPDTALFTEPKDFKKHASMEDLMTANLQRLMQAAPGQ